ncbi:MAG: MFS transporter, partial [Clostridia bacterium]|nr:MFS transporter [Clostridia bacterium]
MEKKPNYRRTFFACSIGFVTQAIAANFVPLLFLVFNKTYGISLGVVALIPVIFYVTQLLTDLVASKVVDKIGYRVCVVTSQVVSAVGLAMLVFLPGLFPIPFIGILIAVLFYAVGSGLVEVLVSPILEACPFKNKNGMMGLLHSFYCWGAVAVIGLSTLFFFVFGLDNWRILALIWAAIPLLNAFNFAFCPIERLVEEGEGMRVSKLLRMPLFWLLVLLMICSGAAEAAMAQWASAFAESALGVSKTIGDLVGPCLFAAFMGISRVVYGNVSQKLDLTITMLICGILCVGCYLLASLANMPIFGLVGCAVCGISVGIMWPGTISLSSQKFPAGGTAMFAFLALAGDVGGTAGPALVGFVSGIAAGNLKIGLLCATIFPAVLVLGLLVLKITVKKNREKTKSQIDKFQFRSMVMDYNFRKCKETDLDFILKLKEKCF